MSRVSNKTYKQIANRRTRRVANRNEEAVPLVREHSNVREFRGEGMTCRRRSHASKKRGVR